LLRIAACAVLGGRAWQFFFADPPLRSLFWSEKLMTPFATGILCYEDWHAYATDAGMNADIGKFGLILGIILLCGAAAAALHRPGRTLTRWGILAGGAVLAFVSVLYYLESNFELAQLLEYSLQTGTPFFLLAAVSRQEFSRRLIWVMSIATAVTFICHGLYAGGYGYPRPVSFTTMVMLGFGIESETAAFRFLTVAAWGDFLAAAFLLLLPYPRVRNIGLVYTIIWGFLTALARVWSFWMISDLATILLQYTHEWVLRWPHFLVPLVLYVCVPKSTTNYPSPTKVTP
ncbi:MAG: hypothetical protein WBA17_11985, partial [Saprospiraceae bacterium]